jgi:hypothetical protein
VGNAVVHFEIGAADDQPLAAFYGQLFGWDLRALSAAGYTLIDTCGGSGINGGIGRSRTGEPWSAFYVEVPDLQASLDRANVLGGATVLPVTDAGGAATIAMFSDPDGLLVGLVKAAAGPVAGPGPSEGPGEPVTWFEIMGSDPARTQEFYADLFGWTIDNSLFADYAVADTGTERGIQGGIGGGADSRWAIVYALVPDAERTLDDAAKLGGSRIDNPSLQALKSASRAALYGEPDESMRTGEFRDLAGNVFGVFSY